MSDRIDIDAAAIAALNDIPGEQLAAAGEELIQHAIRLAGGNPAQASCLLIAAYADFASRTTDPIGLLQSGVCNLADNLAAEARAMIATAGSQAETWQQRVHELCDEVDRKKGEKPS